MLISISTVSTKPTEHTKNIDKAEDKVLTYTEETVQGTYIIEEDTRKAKKIKDSDKRSAIFVTN
jgi:hypothetical protein